MPHFAPTSYGMPLTWTSESVTGQVAEPENPPNIEPSAWPGPKVTVPSIRPTPGTDRVTGTGGSVNVPVKLYGPIRVYTSNCPGPRFR
ncbi:hypothetical protein [Amycolatopsis sp. CA-128772]|uniref:hypothetical protein n=1 Tax=Amycolatopsis sp. CA-128772 TaxID=2073159 RepID=UPI001E29B5D7|nr:hypothetical protein [Amycolatopsis sp. CA-128772]